MLLSLRHGRIPFVLRNYFGFYGVKTPIIKNNIGSGYVSANRAVDCLRNFESGQELLMVHSDQIPLLPAHEVIFCCLHVFKHLLLFPIPFLMADLP